MALYIQSFVVLTLILYLTSSIFYILSSKSSRFAIIALIFSSLGLLANTISLAVRMELSGRLPLVSGPEFLLCFSWFTVLLLIFFQMKSKIKNVGSPVMIIASLLVGSILIFAPGQLSQVSALMPALKSIWLTIHVLTAVIAYGSFALSAGLAGIQLKSIRIPDGGSWVYKIVSFGFVSLTLTIIFGAIWAEQAWGSYWSWDPKETWALITWIIYALYLHLYRKPAWRGLNSNLLVVAGFIFVIFTYFGVNFLLSGLHSYG